MVNGCLMILRLRFVTYSALQGEPPPNPLKEGELEKIITTPL